MLYKYKNLIESINNNLTENVVKNVGNDIKKDVNRLRKFGSNLRTVPSRVQNFSNKTRNIISNDMKISRNMSNIGKIGAVGALVGSALIGAAIQRKINSLKDKNMDCREIKDPLLKDKCTVKILNTMIESLKKTRGECDNTPDPANCKLALIKKIDKLYNKKRRLEKHMSMMYRARVIEKDIS